MVLRHTVKLSKKSLFYKAHFNMLNVLLPNKITDIGILILIDVIRQGAIEAYRSDHRALTQRKLRMSASSFSQHLATLKTIGLLKPSTEITKGVNAVYYIPRKFIPVNPKSQEYNITLNYVSTST